MHRIKSGMTRRKKKWPETVPAVPAWQIKGLAITPRRLLNSRMMTSFFIHQNKDNEEGALLPNLRSSNCFF
jgi:hypothetical protein